MRIIFFILLIIHGTIHLAGFLKVFHLYPINAITGNTLLTVSAIFEKVIGVLWLLTCLLFIMSAVLFLISKDFWWIPAAIGILISQCLIILYWHDARYGSLINLFIFIVIIPSYGLWSFKKTVKEESGPLDRISANVSPKIINGESLASLPTVIQKWMHRSNMVGRKEICKVHLYQSGVMRTTSDGKWMSVKAEQYFTTVEPTFLWIADVQVAPWIHLYGRDKYVDGKGHMLIKLFALYPVADSKGKEIDQGSLIRYLSETVWFPSAALSPYITWESVDSNSAKATMSYMNVSASGIFKFDNDGDVQSFEADRYYDRKEGPTLEKWFISMDKEGYREFEGIRVPAKASVTWKLKSGDFTWYKLEVSEINYDRN